MDIVVALLVVAALTAFVVLRRRRRAELRRGSALQHELRTSRRAAEDDTTRFGEELQALHWETLTDDLDQAMRQDYQRALDSYEGAKELLRDATTTDDVRGATTALEDGRYALACVLARRDGRALPRRRPPCFFNPAHGPAEDDVAWAPPGGVTRDVPVCRADADRLAQGAEPDVRRVRRDGAMVPWWQGGPAYGAWAGGWYGAYAANGLFPAFMLGSMIGAGTADGDWSGWEQDPAGVGEDPTSGSDWSGGWSGDHASGWGGDSGGGWGGDAGGFGGGDVGGGGF